MSAATEPDEPGTQHAKYRVLFLCIHNSGRSQMAEALLRQAAPDCFDVESAGFEPSPVLPPVMEAMRLIGVDISQARSKSAFDLFRAGRIFQYVIAVCDEATAQRCPIFPGVAERFHWSFDDPSALAGSDEEKLNAVIAIRNQIAARVENWLADLRARGGPQPQFRTGKQP